MDIFLIVLLLLFSCWLIVYLSPKLSLTTKYKLTILNFIISLFVIFSVYWLAYGIWKMPVIYWFLLPNIFSGTLFPLLSLIVHTILKDKMKKDKI
ncbi:MAG: hypothetical protein ACRC1P_02765 [Cellulosilyticaceae bacterium]